jgi:hypothetical protein
MPPQSMTYGPSLIGSELGKPDRNALLGERFPLPPDLSSATKTPSLSTAFEPIFYVFLRSFFGTEFPYELRGLEGGHFLLLPHHVLSPCQFCASSWLLSVGNHPGFYPTVFWSTDFPHSVVLESLGSSVKEKKNLWVLCVRGDHSHSSLVFDLSEERKPFPLPLH